MPATYVAIGIAATVELIRFKKSRLFSWLNGLDRTSRISSRANFQLATITARRIPENRKMKRRLNPDGAEPSFRLLAIDDQWVVTDTELDTPTFPAASYPLACTVWLPAPSGL